MSEIQLDNVENIKKMGKVFNQQVVQAYKSYCASGGRNVETSLHSAAAFSVLVLSNFSPDPRKRDIFLKLLQESTLHEKGYKALKVMKWSPVRKALEAYMGLENSTPNLKELIRQQGARMRSHGPAWATLMPDKIYAMTKFNNESFISSVDPLLQPFGQATQAAFAAYSGVKIKGSPKMVHHEYLLNFCQSFAHNCGPNSTVFDVSSGLHVFGEQLLHQ